MRYIELFAGIGGFRKALDELGHECVWANDIDKHATNIYNNHYSEKYEPTDIRTIKGQDIPDHDILCGGFPCQDFSIAGKRQGFNTTRGTLFFEISRIARDKRTPILFLENVKGVLSHGNRNTGIFYNKSKRTYSTTKTRGSDEVTLKTPGETFATITDEIQRLGYLGGAGVLNSKHFGVPQNRERVFIVGVLRGHSRRQIFPVRQDDQKVDGIQGQQTNTLTARYYGAQAQGTYIIESKLNAKGKNKNVKYTQFDVSGKGYKSQQDRVYDIDGVMCTLPHANPINKLNVAVPILTLNRPKKRQNGHRFKDDGEEMFTLTVQDRHGVMVYDDYNSKFRTDGNVGTITGNIGSKAERNGQKIVIQQRIRRLTPKECYRLQGFCPRKTDGSFDDTFYEKAKEVASETQIYKTAGNAVTVNVIKAIAEKF